MKYNIGDKVKVVKKYIPDENFIWHDSMTNDIGQTFEIQKITDDGSKAKFNAGGWYFPVESLELAGSRVAAPTHYTTGEIECIDAIRSALTEEEFRGYCKGNVLKYTWREKLKGGDEDLKKAEVYLSWLITTQKQ